MIRIKAIVLAAGYATRLHPLTFNTPKPLLRIAGKPMIEHILFRIEELDNVDEIFIVTNEKFYKNFVQWHKDHKSNKKITIVNDKTTSNDTRLGAVGDIHFVIGQYKINDDVLVIAGDNLFEFNLMHLDDFFKKKKKPVVALYDIIEKSKGAKIYGIVEIDQNNKIIGFEEKPKHPKTSLVSTACYIFTKKDIELLERCIGENKKPDNLGDFIKFLAKSEQVFGFVFKERWFDIGSHDQLREAHEHWSRK